MKRISFALILGSLVVSLASCDRGPVEKPAIVAKPGPAAVKLVRPHRGTISRWVSLPAEIRPLQQATLYAKTAGYLKSIHVDKGDEVKAGALIAEIENPELLADAARFKAELEVAQINLKRLAEAQQKAPDLVVPLSVDEARSKVDVARANLDRIGTLLAYSKIFAPFDGVVTKRFVDAGAFIPAATSGSLAQSAALVTIMNFDTVRVTVAVPEAEVPFIKANVPMKLTVEELTGKTFEGRVSRFSYALDDATKTMLTEIELPNPNRDLRPGMFATALVAVQTKNDALLVPMDAVLFEKQKTSTFKVVDGKAKKMAVKVGFQDGTSTEILDGLAVDEPIIMVGKLPLNDGQPVQVIP